ncbi:MAG: hypothetical protein ACFCUM_15665 [Bacteroidales bacterium]
MELVAENKVEIINPDKSGDFYLIRADKNSVGDTLDMAHTFFEVVISKWTEPDYFSSSFKNQLI